MEIHLSRLSRKRPKFIPFLEPGLLLKSQEKMAVFSKIWDLVMSLGKNGSNALRTAFFCPGVLSLFPPLSSNDPSPNVA